MRAGIFGLVLDLPEGALHISPWSIVFICPRTRHNWLRLPDFSKRYLCLQSWKKKHWVVCVSFQKRSLTKAMPLVLKYPLLKSTVSDKLPYFLCREGQLRTRWANRWWGLSLSSVRFPCLPSFLFWGWIKCLILSSVWHTVCNLILNFQPCFQIILIFYFSLKTFIIVVPILLLVP